MEAAQIVQRIGTTLAHSLLSEARKPIGVSYESDQGVDMGYTLCSVFYIHMADLQNLVNMPVDLWVSVVYKLSDAYTVLKLLFVDTWASNNVFAGSLFVSHCTVTDVIYTPLNDKLSGASASVDVAM